VSLEAWGDDDDGSDAIVERLLEAGWLTAEDAEELRGNLAKAMFVVAWCIGHAQRNDDAGSLRAVLRENGFIE
jgi:hypothetical protein